MTENKWDGKISNLNISEKAFPELFSELSQMQHKPRCDRLRALALLGLYALRFPVNLGCFERLGTVGLPVQSQPEPGQLHSKQRSQRESLKGKLMESV